MPLRRHEVTLGVGLGDEVTVECLPFNWPRNNWEILELQITRETGWYPAVSAVITKLRNLYGGARGQMVSGLSGIIVQYVEGTGHTAFTVTDWRGNSGSFVFVPDDGLVIREIHGSASDADPLGSAYHEIDMRLVKL